MKPVTALSIFLATLGSAALAQTAVYDTSLLKTGNTWAYARDEEERSAGTVYDGYSGTTRFALDAVMRDADTLRFRVIRRDSLRSKLKFGRHIDSMEYHYLYAADTIQYTLTAQGLSPVPPVFLEGQTFASGDRRMIYRGDTVRYREGGVGGPTVCMWTGFRNVERVGSTYQGSGHGGCGHTSSSKTWTLTEFSGRPYSHADLAPVALRSLNARFVPGHEAGIFQRRGSVLFSNEGRTFDLKGQRVPGKSSPLIRQR